MRKKRLIAFLLSACLAVTPVIGVNASGELDVGGVISSQESAASEAAEAVSGMGEAAGAESGSADSNGAQDAAAAESGETAVTDADGEAAGDLAADGNGLAAISAYSGAAAVSDGDALEGNYIAEDFESVTDSWGMEVPGKGTLAVVDDGTGNKYLQMTTKEAARTTSKVLIEDACCKREICRLC